MQRAVAKSWKPWKPMPWLVALVTMLAPAAPSAGGGTGRDRDRDPSAPTFSTSVDLVTLNVAVRERKRAFVDGLEANDFAVYEDGVAQQLTFFSGEAVPLDLTMLVDVSASMKATLPLVRTAAAELVRALRPGDRAAVAAFDARLQVLQPYTGDRGALDRAIGVIEPGGNTALYTALYVALNELGASGSAASASAASAPAATAPAPAAAFAGPPAGSAPADATPRRHALVVISDGVDTASLVDFDRVLDLARRTGVAVYIVQLGQYSVKQKDVEAMRFELTSLARETGAQAFFPLDGKTVPTICREIADDLSHQYTLGYVSSLPVEGETFRRVTVVVPGRPGVRLQTRTGYFTSSGASGGRLALRRAAVGR